MHVVKLSDLLATLRFFSDRDVVVTFDGTAALICRVEATLAEVTEALEQQKDQAFEKEVQPSS